MYEKVSKIFEPYTLFIGESDLERVLEQVLEQVLSSCTGVIFLVEDVFLF